MQRVRGGKRSYRGEALNALHGWSHWTAHGGVETRGGGEGGKWGERGVVEIEIPGG